MAAIGLAIIGKNNSPLYVREFLSEDGGNCDSDGDFHCGDDEAAALFGLESRTAAGAETATETEIGTTRSRASGKCWFALHAALDRLEQLTSEPKNAKKMTGDNFVGLLLPFGETRVYGYRTITRTSFLLVVEDCGDNADAATGTTAAAATAASGVKRLFETIHELYIQEVMNPFHPVVDNPMDQEELTSKIFDRRVQKHVANFNQQEI
eukprot:jgi/Psemu1/322434/estExt_fgenesh1_pg.C_290007